MIYKVIKPKILIQDTFYSPGVMFQVAKYMKYVRIHIHIFSHILTE